MCKSALEDVNDVNISFSSCRFFCEKKNGNDVLLVEGKTDYIFYSRFTKQYNIFCRIPNIDNDTGNDCTVKGLISEMFPKGKNIYGIIDPDYNNSVNIESSIRNRVHVIDANSLETLIVKYCDKSHNVAKAIANFNILFKKGKFKNKEGKQEKLSSYTHDYLPITEEVLQWAFFIGWIRKINADEPKKYHFNFKLIKENSSKYKKYIKINKINKEIHFDFNKEQYINDLCNYSRHNNDNISLQKIKESILEYNERTVWDICQGHDIFDFIDCLKNPESKPISSESYKGKKPPMRPCPSWETPLLNAFDITNFHGSPLQKWFDEINSKVADCIISR